ncbi:MAG TPA: FAD-linked oxidase C-terminal domain-containing protein [Acidimicrobiales bacterium]
MAGLIEELERRLGADNVLVDPDVVDRYCHDEAEWAPSGRPLAVVRARDAQQVQTLVRFCLSHRVALVPRGAGTGLSGGANATDGCIVLTLEKMDAIVEIDSDERLAVVQPGVVNDTLRAAAAEQGLWYPPDPASAPWSTIGGNVATNAGGLCCVKYGVTADYVLALEVVTGRGDIVRLGRRTAKGVAGYNLCQLFVGSEGTLGVITEVTVRLRPTPPPQQTVVGYFGSIVDAGHAVSAVAAAGIVPSALELVDRHCLRAVDEWKHMDLAEIDAAVLLLGRTDAPGPSGDEEAEGILRCFKDAGATWAARSTDAVEAEQLFEARRLAYPALERLGPVLTEDVCVPRRRVPDMLMRIEEIARRHDTMIANIAHAGDGNLHPLLITPPGDDAARERAQRAFEDIMRAAVELGGTVTAEHGVGIIKRTGLTMELATPVLDMHRQIKAALDPCSIFNPGKVFDSPGPDGAAA